MLTRAEELMHETALRLSRTARETEESLIVVLIHIEKSKFYRKFDHPHLLSYIQDRCKVEGKYAYMLKRVVEVALQFKELETALKNKELNAAKANRLSSSLNEQNQKELVEFAKTHTYAEVDTFALGMECVKKHIDRLKQIGADHWRWTIDLSDEKKLKLERIQAIEAQARRSAKRGDCLDAAMEVYLDHRDKVRKAERAQKRKPRAAKADPAVRTDSAVSRKSAPTAAQKHAVSFRDKSRCQFRDKSGQRCLSQSHVQSHHIVYRSQGGGHEPENMISVCWHHHDLIHQMEIPFDNAPHVSMNG